MSDCSAVYINPKHFQTRDMCNNHVNHYNVMDMCHNHYDMPKPIIFTDPSNFASYDEETEEMKVFSNLSQSYKNSLLEGPNSFNFNYELEM